MKAILEHAQGLFAITYGAQKYNNFAKGKFFDIIFACMKYESEIEE